MSSKDRPNKELIMLLPAAVTILADNNDHWDGPGAWWPVFPLLWFLVVAGIVTAVVVTGRRRARFGGVRSGEARLAERFADGEITEQEYRERLAVLKAQTR
jgi:putative membrane protein